MNRVVPPVLLLHPDRDFAGRVRRGVGDRFALREMLDWAALRAALRDAPSMALVLVDPYEGGYGDRRLHAALRGLLLEFPSATVVAVCSGGRGAFEEMRTLGEWGVTRVLDLGEDDTPAAISRILQDCRGRPLRALLDRSLPTKLSGRGRAIVMCAADVVAAGGLTRDLARSLHVTPRTLQRWCGRAGLLPPRQLLAWMRLLLAAELLDDPGRSVLGVALACGYSSDAALRNAYRVFLALSPSALREQGAFPTVSHAFLAALDAAIAAERATRGPAPHDPGVIPLGPRIAAGGRAGAAGPARPAAARQG